ncbi:MAG TPA: prolyl oligopeptidase family serine peptidase [Rhizomicrobium sp.]|jgi:dipeptidyl aminopeptidase/acylaminoacyl peptidase
MTRLCLSSVFASALFGATLLVSAPLHAASFGLTQVLHYPFATELASAGHANRIGWVRNLSGVRNVWVADGPGFKPRRVTNYSSDDGQEITQITFSPDGARLVYVRGGDHDANWDAEGNLAPDPASSPEQEKVTLWAARLAGGAPIKIAEGDAPAISARGVLAYIANDQVWMASLDGKGKAQRLFFDRGKDSDLRWSPDGSELAFVSHRGDHAFIGVFKAKDQPLLYLAPSTGDDDQPQWSPDGKHIVFVRGQGEGGPPEPYLTRSPHPWSIWVADAASGRGHLVWSSPDTLAGSWPEVEGGPNLHWCADGRIAFLAYLDDWPHLYSMPADGGTPLLLTPGNFMVEHITPSRDGRFLVYDANTGSTKDDDDRRPLFRVPVDRAEPQQITSGETIEWRPVMAANDRVAFVAAGAQQPPEVAVSNLDGTHFDALERDAVPSDFPATQLITPKSVSFTAADGMLVHGQLFQRSGGIENKPGIIFVHGGPLRQMLLGWHYMGYYSNAYAVNQYLANHGFVVLSVNYRLGIGYGRKFQQPDHAGPTGASEYQDVVAGAHFLQQVPGVDANRIGMWGGSYGGYLTGLALARNSDIFKAGVDLHGVHDWSHDPDYIERPKVRYEQGDREEALKTAFLSSPDASIDSWRSPVLLIQGDDDRNVPFQQTIDLARRLEAHHVPFEELVIPNEIHGFLRYASWLAADTAAAEFLTRKLEVHSPAE